MWRRTSCSSLFLFMATKRPRKISNKPKSNVKACPSTVVTLLNKLGIKAYNSKKKKR